MPLASGLIKVQFLEEQPIENSKNEIPLQTEIKKNIFKYYTTLTFVFIGRFVVIFSFYDVQQFVTILSYSPLCWS